MVNFWKKLSLAKENFFSAIFNSTYVLRHNFHEERPFFSIIVSTPSFTVFAISELFLIEALTQFVVDCFQ